MKKLRTEKDIQNWLMTAISTESLQALIEGREKIETALEDIDSPDFWPSFPVDYLSRLQNLRSAHFVLRELNGLELVSTSATSVSRAKGQSLFIDLLYHQPEGSHFVVFELKKTSQTARETLTELFAYEHEILNHIPFASRLEVLFVVVAREFSTLLDHAISGFVTWGRRKVLCLQVAYEEGVEKLRVHIPSSWSAVGQSIFPANKINTIQLCF